MPSAKADAAEMRAIIIFPPLVTVLRMITFAFPIFASSCRCLKRLVLLENPNCL